MTPSLKTGAILQEKESCVGRRQDAVSWNIFSNRFKNKPKLYSQLPQYWNVNSSIREKKMNICQSLRKLKGGKKLCWNWLSFFIDSYTRLLVGGDLPATTKLGSSTQATITLFCTVSSDTTCLPTSTSLFRGESVLLKHHLLVQQDGPSSTH